jgi:hypothetical protein
VREYITHHIVHHLTNTHRGGERERERRTNYGRLDLSWEELLEEILQPLLFLQRLRCMVIPTIAPMKESERKREREMGEAYSDVIPLVLDGYAGDNYGTVAEDIECPQLRAVLRELFRA